MNEGTPVPAPTRTDTTEPPDPAALLGLDHVVIAVQDLQRAQVQCAAQGFTVQPGGRHPGRTSHNALIVFADGSYIELIAWQAPAPQERWWRTLQASGDGMVDFALLPRDTAAAIDAARARGLATITGPIEGSRQRPDGTLLQWRTARQARADLPFLCGDVTPRAWRVPEGDARRHANGASGIAQLQVAVQDLAVSVERYRALLGPHVTVHAAPPAGPHEPLEASFTLGATTIVLAAPCRSMPTDHALRRRLATRGEGPCRMSLLTTTRPPPPLWGTLTHCGMGFEGAGSLAPG